MCKQNKVSIFFMGNTHQLNGAAKIVRIFDDFQDDFQENDVTIENMYTHNQVKNQKYSELNDKKQKHWKLKLKSLIIKFLHNTRIGTILAIEYFYWRRAKKVVKQYNQVDNESLIFHDVFTFYFFIKKFGQLVDQKKTIFVIHNAGDQWQSFKIYFPKLEKTLYYRMLKYRTNKCYEVSSKIIFVSKLSKDYFGRNHSEYIEKGEVIYNGVQDVPFIQKTVYDTIDLITIGTVNDRKNQLTLIKVIEDLDLPDVRLTVVGEGERYTECINYVRMHNLESNVKMLGKRRDIPLLLDESNVFILTSLEEGLPIAGIEALRHGLPLILTDVGGNSELVERNGYLVKPTYNDIRRIVKTIVLEKDKLYEKGLNSRKLYEDNFEQTKMIKSYCNIVKGT